jgi:pyruvate formate lyase activating enzyme
MSVPSSEARTSMETGVVFDVKHFAVHDGPGIRTTVFLKGCPLRCKWCHSPESQSPNVEIAYYPNICIGCGACVEACPAGAQTMGSVKIRRELCTRCGSCADICYAEALVKFGDHVSVEDILQEVEKDRLLYDTSGGGVTLSGGEPAMQPQFASMLLKTLKVGRFHTTLDTCGYVEWTTLRKLLGHTDLVLFDLKHMDPAVHEKLTGVSNELILSNLRRISQLRYKTLIVRVPVIPRYNDSTDNINAIGGFLGGLENVDAVELLPYHRLGVPKYEALGREYSLPRLQPPKKEHLEAIRDLLEASGLKVIIEGVE